MRVFFNQKTRAYHLSWGGSGPLFQGGGGVLTGEVLAENQGGAETAGPNQGSMLVYGPNQGRCWPMEMRWDAFKFLSNINRLNKCMLIVIKMRTLKKVCIFTKKQNTFIVNID